MKITLVRRWFGDNKTIGKIFINGIFCYYALEDVVRPDGVKIQDQTAIPYGKYPISVSFSEKLKRVLPLIENVPNFTGIRIHAGIDETWTSGCLLISRNLENGKLVKDLDAEKSITQLIQAAIDKGDSVSINIINYQKKTIIITSIIISILLALFIISKLLQA